MSLSEKNYEVGDDIDAYCTNCKLNLLHTVASKKDGDVARAQCNTCKRTHKFRPPKIEGDEKTASNETKPKAAKKKKTSSKKSKLSNEDKWGELIEKMNIEDAVSYSITKNYEPDTLINHKKFGIGYIMDVPVAKRIDVCFKDGMKSLIANR